MDINNICVHSQRFPTHTLICLRMCTMPPVYSFISFTSFNYKRATQYSGVPTTEYNGIEYDVDRGLYH